MNGRGHGLFDNVRNFFGATTIAPTHAHPVPPSQPHSTLLPQQAKAAHSPSAPSSLRPSVDSTHHRSRQHSVESNHHHVSVGLSLEANSSFENVVISSLAELNYTITAEFERVRREDLLRMNQLERQIVSSGGTVEKWEDFSRTTADDSATHIVRSVEAALDMERTMDRIKHGDQPTTLSTKLENLRLPPTNSTLREVRSAPGSVRGSKTRDFEQAVLHKSWNVGSAPESPPSRGGSWKPEHLDSKRPKSPKGPDEEPPILHTFSSAHVMPEHVNNDNKGLSKPVTSKSTMNDNKGSSNLVSSDNNFVKPVIIDNKSSFLSGPASDYLGQTEIMSIEINKQSTNDANDSETRVSVVQPVTAAAGTEEIECTGIIPTTNGSCNKHEDEDDSPKRVKSSDSVVRVCDNDGHSRESLKSCMRGSTAFSCRGSNDSRPGRPKGNIGSCRVSIAHSASVVSSESMSSGRRKSCHFAETGNDTLQFSQSADQDDGSSSDSTDENEDEGYMSRRVSQIAARTVRNSLDTSRFQLLPIWNDSKNSTARRQGPALMVEDDTASNGSFEMEHESEQDPQGQLLRKYVMQPNTGFRIPWDYAAALLVAYECVVIPLLFIDIHENMAISIMGWIVRIFWTMDVPASLMTGFVMKDGIHEMRIPYIVKNYLKTWFLIDFLLLVADWCEALLDSLSFISGARSLKILKTLRLCRLLRVIRVTRCKSFPQIIESSIEAVFKPDVIPVVLSVLKIVSIFAWINHLMACFWIAIGEGQYGDSNWVKGHGFVGEPIHYIYACAYHWSLQQFAGAAEVWPWNASERNFAVATGVLTFVAAAFFVSSLTSSMTHFEIVTSQDSRRIAQLKHWLYESGISHTVAVRVQRNAQHALKEEKKNMPESSIELLPVISEPLRMEIHYDMHMQVLATHAFFRLSNEVSSWMMRHICHEATQQLTLSRGDTLFCDGETSQEPRMYFIKSGELQYSHNTGRKETASSGSWASEGGIWTFWTHCGGMLATSDCNLLVLEVPKFQGITGQFSKQREFGKQYGLLFVRHLNSCNMDELTDLEDDEMDIEWLAARSCPVLAKQSGLMAKIMRTESRNSICHRGGSVSFMAMSSIDRALKKPSEHVEGGASMDVSEMKSWISQFSTKQSNAKKTHFSTCEDA